MKRLIKFGIVVLGISVLAACSLGVSEGSKTLDEIDEIQSSMEVTKPEPVEISIDKLLGTWKYAEVRTSPNEKGIAPVGDILFGITSDHTLSFATEGIQELKRNLKSIPDKFEIRDNKICALDDLSTEFSFNLNFKRLEVSCYLLNDNEMALGKGKEGSDIPMIYMYFTRVAE